MATLNVPVQVNGEKGAPTKLYPRELFIQYDSSGNPSNLWVGPYSGVNTDATQTQGTPLKLKMSSSDSSNSFSNDDTFLSNSGSGTSRTRIGNFNVTNSGTSTDRQYKWTTIAYGNITTQITEANNSTKLENYNTFRYINIDQLGRLIANRSQGVVFGNTFPTGAVDGQIFFKIAE